MIEFNVPVCERNLEAVVKIFSDAFTTLYVVPKSDAGADWGPCMVQLTGVVEGFLTAWHVDKDEVAQYRVTIPVDEIGTIEVVPCS